MNFSTDRELLAYEPDVFNDVAFLSQKRVDVSDGDVADTTLTSSAADFADAQVDAGSVVLIGGTGCEVIARVDANTLTVSLPRANVSDAAIPPGDGSALQVIARTFEPQAAIVHDALLGKLKIDPDDADAAVTEDAIVSLSLMSRLEALGTLARLYAAAVATGADNTVLSQKAAAYQQRFDNACRVALVQLDVDGDGHADTTRDLGIIQLIRN